MTGSPHHKGGAALRRHHQRIEAMIADPECVGDLFAFAVVLAQWVDFGTKYDDGPHRKFEPFGVAALGPRATGWRVKALLREDIRRYDPFADPDNGPQATCGAPMVRRHGPCGRSATRQTLVADPDTGRQSWHAACTRHTEWFEETLRTHRQIGEVATPAANTGGVLARHLPEIGWEKVWRGLDPEWVQPPEDAPQVKPTLHLILGDG